MCCNNNQLGFGIGTFTSCGCNGGVNADFVNELASEYRYNGRNGRSGNCGCGCGCCCNNN